MSRFLVVLLLLVIGVIGLGFYLGWFQFSTDHTDQKSNVTFTIDKDKIQQDREKATEKVQEAGQSIKEKIGSESKKGEKIEQEKIETSHPKK